MHSSAGTYPVLNLIIAYEQIQVGLLTSVCSSCLKLDGIVRGLMDDNCVLEFLNHTTKLFNEPWNCSNHAVMVISTKYFLQWGHLWLEPPVSCHDSRTTTRPHNPLYVLHRWYWMPQSHTWQPLSICHQNSPRDKLENYLHQERTHEVMRWKTAGGSS